MTLIVITHGAEVAEHAERNHLDSRRADRPLPAGRRSRHAKRSLTFD